MIYEKRQLMIARIGEKVPTDDWQLNICVVINDI